MSRQQTPDIMGDLMNGTLKGSEPVSNKAIQPQNQTNREEPYEVKQESIKTANITSNKTTLQDKVKEKIKMKEKATFNLSLSSLEALEDAWIKLKRQFKGEQRITKTAIVEAAIEIAIKDLMVRGSDSLLYKELAEYRENIQLNNNTAT